MSDRQDIAKMTSCISPELQKMFKEDIKKYRQYIIKLTPSQVPESSSTSYPCCFGNEIENDFSEFVDVLKEVKEMTMEHVVPCSLLLRKKSGRSNVKFDDSGIVSSSSQVMAVHPYNPDRDSKETCSCCNNGTNSNGNSNTMVDEGQQYSHGVTNDQLQTQLKSVYNEADDMINATNENREKEDNNTNDFGEKK